MYKKVGVVLITVFLSFFFFNNKSQAHWRDYTLTTIFLERDSANNVLQDNEIEVRVSLNWLQVDQVVKFQDITNITEGEVQNKKSKIEDFIKSNLQIQNNSKSCNPKSFKYSKVENIDVLSEGFNIYANYECDNAINKVDIVNNFFITEFPNEENQVEVYKGNGQNIYTVKLTAINNSTEFYKNKQTDISNTGNLLSSNFLVNKFKNLNNLNIVVIILLGIAIGGLHALEGGHSKVILGSLIIDNKISFKKSLVFVSIFTLTHMADIFLVSIFLILFKNIGNLYQQFSNIQTFAKYGMLFISLHLVFKETSYILKHKFQHKQEHEHTHNHTHSKLGNLKSQFTLAFLEGLAPCLTGWTILMLVISTGSVWLIFPVVLSFTLGVFCVLLIFALMFRKIKGQIYKRFDNISKYSSLISSLALLITALIVISS